MVQLGLHGVKMNWGGLLYSEGEKRCWKAVEGEAAAAGSEALQCCEEQAEVSKPAEPLAELISNKEAGAVGGLQPLNLDSAL